MSRKTTLKEVAQAASVSAQTVSRVVNKRPDVAEDTRERIQHFINEMGYQPNTIARSLITRHSFSLGVVTTGLELYGPSAILVGLQQEAEKLGYALTLILTRDPESGDFRQILSEFGSRQVEGVIWAIPPVSDNREQYINPILSETPPLIFLNHPQPGTSSVAIDNRQGAELAVNHLVEQGYRNIGMITGPLSWWEASERYLGWKNVLGRLNLPANSGRVAEGDWTASGGEKAFTRLIDQSPDIDAVFVSNDQMALGVLNAAQTMGISVPEKLGVIGFDDYPESSFFIPALSTIRQPLRELGAAAVREVVQMIRSQKDDPGNYEPKTIFLQPRLVVRESSVRFR